MCTSPTYIHLQKGPGYERTAVPCGKCWACLKNKESDLIAKVLMEQDVSDWGVFLTLTYDDKKLPSHMSAKRLDRLDIKRWLARLRKKHSFRYLIAGEYGKRKQRAHWHAILLGVGMPPEIPQHNANFQNMPSWRYGFTYVEEANFKTIRYCAKYLTKSKSPEAKASGIQEQEMVLYSKNPPLGIRYVLDLADNYVASGIFPRTFAVNPRGAYGTKRRYQISGVSQHLFLDRIFTQWPEAETITKTEWMENATTRWRKWKAEKYFKQLTRQQQEKMIEDGMHLPPNIEGLTASQKLHMLNKIDAKYGGNWKERILNDQRLTAKWLREREAERGTKPK
jgi:hypothetical protein